MDTINEVKKLVEALGGQVNTAKALGIAQPTVSGWITGKHGVSAIVAMRAERLTNGAVLAASLCPELSELPATTREAPAGEAA